MIIAAAAYPLDYHTGFDSFAAKVSDWVAGAAGNGADLLVFPEYGLMEQCSFGGREVAAVGAGGASVCHRRMAGCFCGCVIGQLARSGQADMAPAEHRQPGSSRFAAPSVVGGQLAVAGAGMGHA